MRSSVSQGETQNGGEGQNSQALVAGNESKGRLQSSGTARLGLTHKQLDPQEWVVEDWSMVGCIARQHMPDLNTACGLVFHMPGLKAPHMA